MPMASFFAPLKAQDVTFTSGTGPVTLVELFSSEGCSSCPPAEEFVSHLKDSPRLWKDVFPVVFHVDYWDGLGWPDRFARPAYTDRQRDYAARLGQDSVYTPEFVVNAREWRGFFHGEDLPVARGDAAGKLTVVNRADEKFSATYEPTANGNASGLTANFAVLGFNVISDVRRGENGGQQLRHDFVVLGFSSAPLVKGVDGKLESGPIQVPATTNDPVAAVVGWISTRDGSPVQVAGGWVEPG